MDRRQIWKNGGKTTTTSATAAHCTAFALPSNGILSIAPSFVLTLTDNAVFSPECTGTGSTIIADAGAPLTLTDFRYPFYESLLPACYVLAATTCISYMLVIMLLITPRTFLHEGAVALGRRGFTNGPSGSDAGIGIGGRPWLQKVAALTVAISLTIATADTFKVAKYQYDNGYEDAPKLQDQVEDSTELKVIRIISDTFLWLAQAQTLIRLFPRQREKVIIKWTAFVLIALEVIFASLNDFVYDGGGSRPRSFVDAMPALSYLFQLALGLLYCAWVIYYSITKRRYAFYHPQMWNICLVAFLSLVSILVPVVFFVLDISRPSFAGWGDYVRWVGAAAASVVVWEWVERIEALERNEKKDGVLGREIFDGDEMLEFTPSIAYSNTQRRNYRGNNGGNVNGNGNATGTIIQWPGITSRHRPYASRVDEESGEVNTRVNPQAPDATVSRARPPLWPSRPPPTMTPVSRTDTTSAESTLYAVRYHPISEATPPIREDDGLDISDRNSPELATIADIDRPGVGDQMIRTNIEQMQRGSPPALDQEQSSHPWRALTKIKFLRNRTHAPPPEVSRHIQRQDESNQYTAIGRWDVRQRLEHFAVAQADKLRELTRPNTIPEPLIITSVPAPIRRRNLTQALEELESPEQGQSNQQRNNQNDFNMDAMNNAGSSIHRQPEQFEPFHRRNSPRSSNPYTPNDLDRHVIAQRGSISFVTAVPQDRDRHAGGSSIASPQNSDIHRANTANSLRRSPSQIHNATTTRQDGVRVTSVPAPPRRPMSPEG